jgi:transcriptional antiterminator RfaH
MPLLSREPILIPETLFADGNADSEPWWVLYTLARQEKQMCRHLYAAGHSFYCPIIERRYRSPGGRARSSYLPLFPNYVFLCGDENARYHAVATGCVSRCLPVSDPTNFVAELRQLQQLIELGVPLTPEERLQPGMRVRVKNGPFAGVEGFVLKRHSERKLLVMVNFIQRGASMELGDYELEQLV